MLAAELTELKGQMTRPYLEFMRSSDLSVGLYRLPVGGTDQQQPHTEDEVYYVESGRAKIIVGEETRPVQSSSVIFVAAGVDHRFFDIEEELYLLVFFGPAEYSRR